jgi:glucokinase
VPTKSSINQLTEQSTDAPAFTIGLDMGGTKCAGVLINADDVVLAEFARPTPGREGRDAVLKTLETVASTLFDVAAQHGGVVTSLGVGVPGMITTSGELRFAGHLGGYVGLPLPSLLQERFDVPVSVDNDNTCAGYAEWAAGAGQGHQDLLFVGFGTGIGGGIISGGRLQRGANGFAGEIGHITLDAGGPSCTCGRQGCWELYASGLALGRQGSAAMGSPMTGIEVMEAGVSGRVEAVAVLEQFGRHIARGLVDLIMVLDPSSIVLGGGVLTRHDVLLPLIRSAVHDLIGAAADLWPLPDIQVARFGPRAAAMGAAFLARQQIVSTH